MKRLKELYEIHSPSKNESHLKEYLKKWIDTIPDCEYTEDWYGNMYITKGLSETYPCVVAHLDQVQTKHSDDFKAMESDGVIFGFSKKNKRQEGLGADDKNGIWIAMQCLEKYDAIKVAFFVAEEIGCVGSSSADVSFFMDCRFIIEPDRKGSSDLITSIFTDICSDEFINSIPFDEYGYKEQNGMLTDVAVLSESGVGLSCLNISCGYYNPHSDEEFTIIDDLLNCFNLICWIIENCQDVYYHTPKVKSYSNRYYSGYDYYGITDTSRTPVNVIDCIYEVMDNNPDLYPEDIWDLLDKEVRKKITYQEFSQIAYDYWYEYYLNDTDEKIEK